MSSTDVRDSKDPIITAISFRSVAVTGAAALALSAGVAGPAAASHDVTTTRVAGVDRIDTAATIAEQQYDATDWALIARADLFPDALSAAPLGAELSAPVLLTNQDDLPDRTVQALQNLEVSQVKILGGTAAVSEDVADQLTQEADVQVDRIAGDDRYATAAEVARFVQNANSNAANFPGDVRAAFVASGERFPDALSAGAPSARNDQAPIPVLLTPADEAASSTVATVEDLQIEHVFIVGGSAAVSPEVAETLDDEDTDVSRIAGATRTETATAMADFAIEFLGFDPGEVGLARGDDFPDALAAGPFAGPKQNPVLLTSGPDTPSQATLSWLRQHCPDVRQIRAFGGEAAITTGALQQTEEAARECHDSDGEQGTQQTYIVAPQEPIQLQPGDSRQFEVQGRYDQQPLTHELDIVLFPCDAVEEPQDGDYRFVDSNGDGNADGIASSETNAAVIAEVNGQDIEDTKHIRDVGTGANEQIEATVSSDAADCAAIVYFHDENDNSALEVDPDGDPVEPWGFGKVSWS